MAGKKKKKAEKGTQDGWLARAAEKTRREKQALSQVFSSDQEARQKDMESLQEIMKKEEVPPEEKGGPLYTPLSQALDKHMEKRKAMSQVFSSEQERREKQRQALKSWIMGEEKPDKSDKS
jgi:hypothetical protein